MKKSTILYLKFIFSILLLLIFNFSTYSASTNISELENLCQKYEQERNTIELAKCQLKLAFAYRDKSEYNKSIYWFQKAFSTNESLGNINALKVIYTNLGLLYSELNNFDEAIENLKKALLISEKQNKKSDIVSDLINIAIVQQSKGSYIESNNFLTRAQGIAQELNDVALLRVIYGTFSENFEKLGKPDKAKEYFELAGALKSHMQKQELQKYENLTKKAEAQVIVKEQEKKHLSEELAKAYNEKELILKLLQQEKELSDLREKEFQTKEKLQQAKQQKTNLLILSLGSILIIISLFLIIIFRQLYEKKKANELLALQNEQIAEQKQEIEAQRDIATQQKKKLTDSIQYARRIQQAVLPPSFVFERIFPQHFILYKPKDIVSGDFYWITAKDNVAIVAVADCTGHGVPGGFMSMLGIAFLNEIVNKITINRHIITLHANEILNELRENIISSLHQTGRPTETKDGMDIALCVIDFENRHLQFAGAHNPLYLIRNGELKVFEADRMPIGIYKTDNKSFTNHEFSLEINDQIYLFTDGYYDQIGGDRNMKMMSVNFRKYLLEISQQPMSQQKVMLESNFENWKGENDQVDDVLLLGIKFTQKPHISDIDEEYLWENIRILIAEDVDINYFLIVEVLKRTHAQIIRAVNGIEAVELCQKQHFDIILMDIRMPEMDGIEATKAIRMFNPSVPIIAQTAYGDQKDIERILLAGCNDHIAKPINLKTFLALIKKYLNK